MAAGAGSAAGLVGTGGAAAALEVMAGGERHCIESAAIAEVVRPPPITRVPMAPPALLGLVSLHGRVLPVIALAPLLGLPGTAGRPGRLVVLARAEPLAIAVEAVGGLRGQAETGSRALPLDALLAQAFDRPGMVRAARPAGPRPAAGGTKAGETAEDIRAVLRFALAGQAFGLPLEVVREVCDAPPGVLRPGGRDAAVQGVMEHRGRLLALLRPEVLLGLAAGPPRRGRVIVIRHGGARLGLLVDHVDTIERIGAGRIARAPALLNRAAGEARIDAVARTDRGLVALLAPGLLFHDAGIAAGAEDAPEEDAGMDARAAPERLLLFRLGEERYALPVSAVQEVIRYPAGLARVPGAPAFLSGLASHRGGVLPVIEQRARFGVRDAAPLLGRRVIVTRIDDLAIGFAVDAVEALREIEAEALSETPAIAAGDGRLFDRVARIAVDGRPVLLVDPRELLDRAGRDLVAGVAAGATREPA